MRVPSLLTDEVPVNVASLALPFFGLIALGFACGKLVRYPEAGLQWMNFFIVYLALPALFFKLISAASFEQLANGRFILGTTLSTALVFSLSLAISLAATRGDLRRGAIDAVIGAYSNIGYMGPGLTIAALGQAAIVPAALIFVFDNMIHFTAVPFLMALGNRSGMHLGQTAWYVVKRVVTHPFNIATAFAVLAAYWRWTPPDALDVMLTFLKNAAAPCALFTMGVTVALRPVKGVDGTLPVLLFIKLVVHPLLVWFVLSELGDFGREWTFTAVLMAGLPPALNIFVLANQYRVSVERASSAILLGTLGSIVTVTALLAMIAGNMVPYDIFR